MLPPTHGYLENTIESMQQTFALGAHRVEFDIHPTLDGQFAVFHDWTLDCRTDGTGVTREHTLHDLQQLDIGFGYTADGGLTFPFRGEGRGLMPSLDDVLKRFPTYNFLINIKSNDLHEGRLLAAHLAEQWPHDLHRLAVYGGSRPVDDVVS